MSNFVDEPPSLKDRFDAIETVLAIQRKRLEDIEDGVRNAMSLLQMRSHIDDERQKAFRDFVKAFEGMIERQEEVLHNTTADLRTVKQALGIIIAGLTGAQVGITEELATALGLKTSRIAPPSPIIHSS